MAGECFGQFPAVVQGQSLECRSEPQSDQTGIILAGALYQEIAVGGVELFALDKELRGPPAHVLVLMSQEAHECDRVGLADGVQGPKSAKVARDIGMPI